MVQGSDSILSYLPTPLTSTSHLRRGEKRMLDHIIRFIALILHDGVNLLVSQMCFGRMLSPHLVYEEPVEDEFWLIIDE